MMVGSLKFILGLLVILVYSPGMKASEPDDVDRNTDREEVKISPLEQPDLVPSVSAPDTLRGWSMSWNASLHGSQATYSNWSRGGVNALNLSSSSLIELMYRRGKFIYETRVRNRFGQARIEEEGVRKTDDQLTVRNRFLYDINQGEGEFKLFGNVNFETQFTKGYNYGAGEDGEDILTSDFMAPAYLTQNSGIAYYPNEDLSIETGLGLKQTVVQDTSLSERYGMDEGQQFKSEAGFTFGVIYEHEIMENVTYKGYLETFTNMLESVRRTDLFLSSQVTGKVNSHIDVVFRLDVVYDHSFSNQLQVNQAFSAGVNVSVP